MSNNFNAAEERGRKVQHLKTSMRATVSRIDRDTKPPTMFLQDGDGEVDVGDANFWEVPWPDDKTKATEASPPKSHRAKRIGKRVQVAT